MKRLISTLAVAVPLFFPMAVHAEVIRNFSVDATVTQNRHLTVHETIKYDFETEEHHGIYRTIPVRYDRNGVGYNLHLSNIHATMDGKDAPTDITTEGEYLNIKIGDPDVTVTGTHAYVISYETDRAINFFPDHSELYWNVTGNEWAATIEQSDFTLHLPSSEASSTISLACYTGEIGSTESACDSNVIGKDVSFKSQRVLDSYEGLTVVVGMPNGMVTPLTVSEKFWMVVNDNIVLFFPLVALIIMLLAWWKFGRDPHVGTIIPMYEPPTGMSPAEIAAAKENGAVPSRAITALIIDLARRGYLHIKYEQKKVLSVPIPFMKSDGTAKPEATKLLGGLVQVGEDVGNEKVMFMSQAAFTFVRMKDVDGTLSPDETTIMRGLFGSGDSVSIDDLKENKFYEDADSAKEAVWKRIAARHIFDRRPSLVRTGYVVAGFITAAVFMFFFAAEPLGLWVALSLIVIIGGIGWFMPRRTEEGRKLYADIKGFEWFLTVTEKDRLAFHNAPEKTPEQFQTMLPYAIALGVETAWAKQFAGLDMRSPQWAEGDGWRTMNTVSFVSSLNAMHTQASASAYSAPSSAGSGGSGFSGGGSGGGFGGGGGGSW